MDSMGGAVEIIACDPTQPEARAMSDALWVEIQQRYGLTSIAAINGCPETASFVAERDKVSGADAPETCPVWCGLATATVGAGSHADGEIRLACASSPFTGFACADRPLTRGYAWDLSDMTPTRCWPINGTAWL